MCAADPLAADADVGGEQIHVRIQVAHVERQRVLRRQHADFLDRLQALDARGERAAAGVPPPGGARDTAMDGLPRGCVSFSWRRYAHRCRHVEFRRLAAVDGDEVPLT